MASERPGQPQQSAVEITEIRPDQNGDLNNEFATVQNTGDTAIDFSGFIISFEAGSQNYTFNDFTLGAGETVTVRNGTGRNTESTLYADFGGPVLNNSNPDTVLVANDERIVLAEGSYLPV